MGFWPRSATWACSSSRWCVLKKDDMMSQATSETSSAARSRPRSREPILFSLFVVDFVLFASGAVAHMGVPIPLGFGTWNETYLVPAAIVEGVGALALAATLVSLVVGATWSGFLACLGGCTACSRRRCVACWSPWSDVTQPCFARPRSTSPSYARVSMRIGW